MWKSALSKVARLLQRRSGSAAESGQAIIILALGFIALVAFVGIVTDVSLMFVRYSTLSRAVDSAAIAAAGQMRSDRSFGEVGLAARQFVEFHGLDPEQVLVETCQTAPKIDHDNNPTTPDVKDPGLCPPDQRKLVRVTATINSPTIFMRLLGFSDILLTAVAVSETAVLDVVILMDVSESMLFDTTYADWAKIGMGKVYYPPRLGGISDVTIVEKDEIDPGTGLPSGTAKPSAGDQVVINPVENGTVYAKEFMDQWNSVMFPPSGDPTTDNDTSWVPTTYTDPEPIIQKFWDDMVIDSMQQTISNRLFYQGGSNHADADVDYTVQTANYPGGGTFPGAAGVVEPRSMCRVRFWPNSIRVPVWEDTKKAYNTAGLPNWPRQTWDGFVPTYNFYGCCNDPTSGGQLDESGNLIPLEGQTVTTAGDFRFNDLICQPFRQARPATSWSASTLSAATAWRSSPSIKWRS
jgi:hypothetical protein